MFGHNSSLLLETTKTTVHNPVFSLFSTVTSARMDTRQGSLNQKHTEKQARLEWFGKHFLLDPIS
jgi:hypothetical protein